MNQLTFSPQEVLQSHADAISTRHVTSVIPEETAIEVDPGLLLETAERLGIKDFHRRGIFTEGPRNLLQGVSFQYLDGLVDIKGIPEAASSDTRKAIESTAEAVERIDNHFRTWSGISTAVPTKPLVSLFVGMFNGKRPTDTNRHFDFKGRIPVVSYKDYFDGDPEFSSLYFPGRYKLPSRLTQISRAVGGIPDPEYPKPLFNRKEAITHLAPAKVVWVEPWNAYHSGPKDHRARGTQRGILDVAYDLSMLPQIQETET